MFINNNYLKFIYSALLTGLPSISYNPFNKNTLIAPFLVNEGSTYINYKLDDNQYRKLNKYLLETTNNLKLRPIHIFKPNMNSESNKFKKDYYISINIYNCSSPLFSFLSNEPVTRCEINTYIINDKNEVGTLIMDYTSNVLSMDPDNIFKFKKPTKFKKYLDNNILKSYAYSDTIKFDLEYDCKNILSNEKINNKMVRYSDKIFYNNGIYDKLYYDSSFIDNELLIPYFYNVNFNFIGIDFKNPESIFFFKNKLNFVGGMWDNLKEF
tara:strand:+ start:419 stop:1222 length:804 start_codon:yes stop_codon:yes gene_type:complete